ncbi:MAG: tRNA pseudouridine(38-40) synthase TruA [Clostridia bacterium]|nr:tRNA pseudouridine(38-40) synthase TruA [Clostridia bacterium]
MHLKIQCEYLGTKYAGFQSQIGQRTIQNELEKAISRYFATPVKVVGSGRTDAGVHAVGQVVSCLCPREDIKIYQFLLGVNSYLPADIAVTAAELLPKFNARSDAKAKTYIYKCYVSAVRHPAFDSDHWQLYKPVDIEQLRAQAQVLVGTHDFTSFCAELRDKSPVRTIYSLDIQTPTPQEIWFVIRGNGFLHNMVRIIVGTLLQKPDVARVLAARDRRQAGKTAPAKGLTLYRVEY